MSDELQPGITEAEFAKVVKYLKARGVSAECSECGSLNDDSWIVANIVVPPLWKPGIGYNLGYVSSPLVQIVCPNCSHVRFFAISDALGIEGEGE